MTLIKGRLEDSIKLKLVVSEVRERDLGAEHPLTLTALGNLAATYTMLGMYDKGLKLERRVLDGRHVNKIHVSEMFRRFYMHIAGRSLTYVTFPFPEAKYPTSIFTNIFFSDIS